MQAAAMDMPRLPSIVVDDYPAARRSMRISVVTETYPPEVNGVATTVARVVQGLRERNHDLQLVRPRREKAELAGDTTQYEEILLAGLPIPRYPHLKMGVPSTKALMQLWTRRRPDIVHIATEGPLGWSALRAATRLKLPTCSEFRTNFHAYTKHYGIGWLRGPIVAYLRKFHNRTLCTMVPTEALRQELARIGFDNVMVLPRGVDTRRFDPARRSEALRRTWGASAVTPVVLCVGRLAPEKNLGTLLQAFEAMRAIRPDTRLVLVGDGPSRNELQQRCPDAVFAGVRTGDDLAAHYASADFFLFPSLTETFGNVTPEAMASGLAVLAFDHAAAAQLIRSGENGLLAHGERSDTFVHAACRLLADRDGARAMGLQARATACGLGWDPIIDRIEAVFIDAMQHPVAQRRHGVVAATTTTNAC
jgi:glycosyltransferase involved in cell wall biosynthesis